MKKLIVVALLCGLPQIASASEQDVSAISGYVHAVSTGENKYDHDHSAMIHAFFSVAEGAHPSNAYLRELMTRTENDLIAMEMLQAPSVANPQAKAFMQSAAIYNQAYAANADKILHQLFSIGPTYSMGDYLRDAALEDAKGTRYTHKALKDTLAALLSEGLSHQQAASTMLSAIQ